MLRVIKDLLLKIIEDIDAGNSNISEEEAMEVTKILGSYTHKSDKLSKYQACKYLNVSRATFDNYVRSGLIPKGKKEAGFKELFYLQSDLDKLIKVKNKLRKK